MPPNQRTVQGRIPRPFLRNEPVASTHPGRSSQGVEGEGAALQFEAEQAQSQQEVLIEQASTELPYAGALADQIEAKHEQVGRIEQRIEASIERTEADMQRLMAARPGLLSMPGARAKWQRELDGCQARMHSLHERMERVHEIQHGMGLHAPRIEEMAARKVRSQQPELAAEWDEHRAALRGHQALMRKMQQERRRRERQEQERQQRASRKQSLGIAQD